MSNALSSSGYSGYELRGYSTGILAKSCGTIVRNKIFGLQLFHNFFKVSLWPPGSGISDGSFSISSEISEGSLCWCQIGISGSLMIHCCGLSWGGRNSK
jgi:hypothetical protein